MVMASPRTTRPPVPRIRRQSLIARFACYHAQRVSLVLALVGCHRHPVPPRPANQPIKVVFATCAGVTECARQCDAGVAVACVEAGRLYEFGHAGARDAARAFTFYDRSCALGNVSGCYNVAVLLETGSGAAKDATRARELFERVCQMGSKTACARAETLAAVRGAR
jgi:TPR repeat protein